MDAKDLQKENKRLAKLLSESLREAAEARTKLAEARAQHQAVAEQFAQTLAEKDQRLASLEHQAQASHATRQGLAARAYQPRSVVAVLR